MKPNAVITVPTYQRIERYGSWLQELIQARKVENQIAEWLHAYNSNNTKIGLEGGESFLTLYADKHAVLTVRYLAPVTSQGRASDTSAVDDFTSLPVDAFLAVLGSGQVRYLRYEIDCPVDDDAFAEKASLRVAESIDVRAGDIVYARANKDILDTLECPSGAVLVQLTVNHRENAIIWHYDRNTLRVTRGTAAEVHATRQQVALHALKRLDYTGYTEVLKDAANGSPWHFVRWDATRDWAIADPRHRGQIIANALNDRHRQVRAAAATLLNKLGIDA